MTSSGAFINIVAYGAQDALLPAARQSSIWTTISGQQDTTADTTYTYEMSPDFDLFDCVNLYLTLKSNQQLLNKLSTVDIIDRIYFGTTDPDHDGRLAVFDGWALEKDPVCHGDILYVPISLASCNLPRFPGTGFKVRIRFKLPVVETSLGVRKIYLDSGPRRDLFNCHNYPYMTHGSAERIIEPESSTYRMLLDMDGTQAPVTDMFLSLHDMSGKAVHCIDQVLISLNGSLLFYGDEYLCRYHIPRQLYGVAENTDRYYIPFAEKPREEPGKGTVNLARIETPRLALQFSTRTVEMYRLRLSWRYHNVLQSQVQSGGHVVTGAKFDCGSAVTRLTRNTERVGSQQWKLDAMGNAGWLLAGKKGATYSYVITEDILDPSAVFSVSFDDRGRFSIQRETDGNCVPDIELLVSDRLQRQVTTMPNRWSRALPVELVMKIWAYLMPSAECTLVNKSNRPRWLQVHEHVKFQVP